jgi:hypothetical protein
MKKAKIGRCKMKVYVCIRRDYSGCGGPGYENDKIIKLTSNKKVKLQFLEENEQNIVQEFEVDEVVEGKPADENLKIKTIDIIAKEWRDKVNGNSYFSVRVTLDLGLKTERIIFVPFQYGYGNAYEYEVAKAIFGKDEGKPHRWKENTSGVIVRSDKHENCLKRDVVAWGKSES